MANFMRKVKREKKKRSFAASGFNPNLDMQMYLSIFNSKYKSLEELAEKIVSLSEEELQEEVRKEISLSLYKDNMFSTKTFKLVKEYTEQVNKMGGVLLTNEVESMFSKEELEQFYIHNFKLYMYINIYYRLFFENLVLSKIENKSKEYKDKIIKYIFPEYNEFYQDFTDLYKNFRKDVIPEYVFGLASDEANDFVIDCYNGKKHNTKLIFKYSINKEKRENLSNEDLFKEAKNLLEIASEFI